MTHICNHMMCLSLVLSAVLLICCPSVVSAQEVLTSQNGAEETDQPVIVTNKLDSALRVSDSVIAVLRSQVQELQLRGILMEEELERTGQTARENEAVLEARRQRVDSLRRTTKGVPLVVDGDTLLTLYARRGGLLPEQRVFNAYEAILSVGKTLAFKADSVYVFESDFSTDIMAGERVILSLTDLDGLWNNTTRQQLAATYSQRIQLAVDELHADYGLQKKLMGVGLVVFIIVLQWLCIKLTNRLFVRWKFRWSRRLLAYVKPWKLKDYELLDSHRQGVIIMRGITLLRYLVILLQLFISVPLLFSIFPATQRIVFRVIAYIWDPIEEIFDAVVDYLPNLFNILVIVICFRYIVRGLRYMAGEIASGKLVINGFYPDWAYPTFYILRILLYAFMFVLLWPLLPSSNSQVFQGVSVFIGVIFSLGSTSVVGNIVAGLVMTYMRPFQIGDYIKFGDTVGEVVEKTMLVTRIRTRKNEVVTIPNSNLLSSQTSNFSFAAKEYGIIVHTSVTIGYEVSWKQIEQLMTSAALATEGIKKTPRPFMVVKALDDYYVEYEINAFTSHAQTLPLVYSTLHKNILDKFHAAGVEIMSPHVIARRDGLKPQIPPMNEGTKIS